jgi:dihydroorotase
LSCSLAIDQGNIFKIGKETNMPKADQKVDLKNLLVLPGLIDAHVHLRDEGKSYKEDFYSGTAAAAAGGITTVLDMPNNVPVTMSVETLRNRMKTAEKKILVNVGFFSEFPKELRETKEILAEGASAFKLFLADQVGGVNISDDEALEAAFRQVSKFKVPVAVHAEDRSLLKEAEESRRTFSNDIDAFLKVHSEAAEFRAVERVLAVSRQTSAHIHFCHVSTAAGLKAITEAKKSKMVITCEVTPHHLFLSVDDLKRCGTLALTVPPIREKHQAEALWNGVSRGEIDILVSDHAPHTLEEKTASSVWDVKVGIPGLETTLSLLLTMVKKAGLSITHVVRLLAEKPADIFKLKGRGYLKEGNHADLVIVDLKRRFKIDASKFYSKAKYSPFDGWNTVGKAVKTFVNGELVMEDGEIVAKLGSGRIIGGNTP